LIPNSEPIGTLVIADIRHTRVYARELEARRLAITDRRSLGVRFWYAFGPWGGDPPGRREQTVENVRVNLVAPIILQSASSPTRRIPVSTFGCTVFREPASA
jgi:hypothetical protein